MTNAEKQARYQRRHPEWKAYNTRKVAEYRLKRRLEGLCIICGAREPVEGRVTCRVCLDRNKQYKARKKLTN